MTTRKLFTALLTLLIISFSGCAPFAGRAHPTDAKLIENFQSRKAEFNQLREMFLADRNLTRVARDFTRPENPQTIGVSAERIDEYRKLFDYLDLSAGIEGYKEKEAVWFLASTEGLSVGGSVKGYAFLKERPDLLTENLDAYQPLHGKSFTAFRHIEGSWYLYLDYED